MKTTTFLVMLSIVILTLLSACSSGYISSGQNPKIPSPTGRSTELTPSPVNSLVQSGEGGGVTIEASWEGIQGNLLVFEINMNTHSVDLDGFDLLKLSKLEDGEGQVYQPVTWTSPPGGHHRSGTLKFAIPGSLSEGKTGQITLVFLNIATPGKRELTWEFS